MKSPFPGMDPYLEVSGLWLDFHESFLTYCRDALNESLPDAYEARLDERVRIVDRNGAASKDSLPDVGVTKGAGNQPSPSSAGTVGILTPIPLTLPTTILEEVRETRIEVIKRPERELVTTLELLSPTNKGVDYEDYWSKRHALLGRRVHYVEIDFLVVGRRPPLGDPWPPGHYYVMVARGENRPRCEVYTWTVRQGLPEIAIPLRRPDPDVALNLAAVFNTTFEKGRYRSLNYAQPPAVPLAAEDLNWATELGRGHLRGSS